MQIAGQSTVNYIYDNADRLIQISQSSSNTSFAYGNANRRTSLTLPNGVIVSYSYDNDSRLTGIAYQFGLSTLGNLTYAYDLVGRGTQVGGSFARTGLPGAVSFAAYDSANELTDWNGITLTYDANENMLNDGSSTFAWNARNQVVTLNNVSLQYDAFGRRIKNLAGTSFLYDRANAAQELSGTAVTANLLSGGIDEAFTRADSSGAFVQLKDALGSTIALADSNGNVRTSYTYDPFGNTSINGTSNANVFQYTGRENESNGLYFYRARYYSPLLERFTSEDPLGFAGRGPNLYAYVGENRSAALTQREKAGCAHPSSHGVPDHKQQTPTRQHVGTRSHIKSYTCSGKLDAMFQFHVEAACITLEVFNSQGEWPPLQCDRSDKSIPARGIQRRRLRRVPLVRVCRSDTVNLFSQMEQSTTCSPEADWICLLLLR